jgi:thiol:disulfide interchange protein DsbD
MRTWLAMALLAAAAALACAQQAPPPDPVTWSLAAPSEAKAGGRLPAKLTARIADGWHLYSLEKQEGGPIPTSVAVPPPQPFRIAGAIDAPPPLTANDEMFGMEVEFYIGEVEFGLPITVAKETQAGEVKLVVTARYQACDNKLCLAPKTVRLERPVKVKPL